MIIHRHRLQWEFAKGRLEEEDRGNLVKRAFVELEQEAGVTLRYWPPRTHSVVEVGQEHYSYRGRDKVVHWFHFHSADGSDYRHNGPRERATKQTH